LEAGVEIPCAKEKLPSDKQILGQHIAEYAQRLSTSEQETYQKQFSQYLKEKLQPEQIPEHFSQTKEKIEKSFKMPKEEKKPETKVKTKEKPKTKPKPKAKTSKPKQVRKSRKKRTEEKGE
jgi:outer membrane biosynthesis protein TonB